MSNSTPTISTKERLKAANRVTLIGSMVNLLLSIIKLFTGIVGRSHAMIADAIHSLSDLGTDIAVLVGLSLGSHPEDKTHNYGHGKYETFATLIIAITLLSVGGGLGYSGVQKIISLAQGKTILSPSWIALIGAVLSLFIKELLFRYSKKEGERLNSSALIANAYHHRSDAYSSLGTGLGITGAILLGNQWVILDPIAAVVVSILVLKEGISIGYTSVNDLLEASLPPQDRKTIIDIAKKIEGVIDPHNLKTRRIGCTIALDLHIRVNEYISVKDGHTIAHNVEDALMDEFGKDLICSIHVEPQSCSN